VRLDHSPPAPSGRGDSLAAVPPPPPPSSAMEDKSDVVCPSVWKPGMKSVLTEVDDTVTVKKKEAPIKATVEESTSTERSLPEEPKNKLQPWKISLT